MDEEKRQELQQKYVELQMIIQQMSQIQQHIQHFEEQLAELMSLENDLEGLKETKVGTELLVPISSGIFVKAELKDNDELAVNVGAGAVVKKSIAGTKELVKKQYNEIKKLRASLTAELHGLAEKAEASEKEMHAMASDS